MNEQAKKLKILTYQGTMGRFCFYSDLQKHESSCLLSDCFSCISPEPLEIKKLFLSICILV